MNAVIIHMGKNYSDYITDCIDQFFIFNRESILYFLVDNDFSQVKLLQKKYKNLKVVLTNTLKKSFNHRFFLLFNRNAYKTWRSGFWRYTIERFFTLDDFLRLTGEENILHFECDNLIYENITRHKDAFIAKNKLGLLLDTAKRCIPSVVFIPKRKDISKFCSFYNIYYTLAPYKNALKSNDMISLGYYWKKKRNQCFSLPMTLPEYGKVKNIDSIYYQEYSNIKSLFDAAAYGQYVGGLDQRYEEKKTDTTGFINEACPFNPNEIPLVWTKNDEDLCIPFIEFPKNTYTPLFNLHIHSKELVKFKSTNTDLLKGTSKNSDKKSKKCYT